MGIGNRRESELSNASWRGKGKLQESSVQA